MYKVNYPIYYDVEGIPVILKLEGNEVVGKCANGQPYAIGKAIVLGCMISKKEYIKLSKIIYGCRHVS